MVNKNIRPFIQRTYRFLTSLRLNGLVLSALALLVSGCTNQTNFSLNAVYLHRYEKELDLEFDSQSRQDIGTILVGLFGTPDEPNVPQLPAIDTSEVIDINRALTAAPNQSQYARALRKGFLFLETVSQYFDYSIGEQSLQSRLEIG